MLILPFCPLPFPSPPFPCSPHRILERYPSNAKLYKCYGRFLEEVCNDIRRASKYYFEAARLVGGDSNPVC